MQHQTPSTSIHALPPSPVRNDEVLRVEMAQQIAPRLKPHIIVACCEQGTHAQEPTLLAAALASTSAATQHSRVMY